MKKVLVLYYSRHGATKELSKYIANGIESATECEAVIRTVAAVSTVCEATENEIPAQGDIYASMEDLENCDGLILGSPTRFGTIAAPLKYFFDQTTQLWINGTLNNKPAAVFTSTSSMHGGQESTLLSMMLPLIHHGMLIVTVPFNGTRLTTTRSGGTPYGASHLSGVDGETPITDEEKEIASYLGKRVASVVLAMDQGSII